MQFLQNVDFGTVAFVGVGCAVLCVVGLVVFFGMQLVGTTLQTFVGLTELFGNIITGGPLAWCGCIVILFICAMVVGGAILVVTCRTNPSAMNFCLLIPK